jgi:hypothetical protein
MFMIQGDAEQGKWIARKICFNPTRLLLFSDPTAIINLEETTKDFLVGVTFQFFTSESNSDSAEINAIRSIRHRRTMMWCLVVLKL